ncbi:MAG: hypothetical protein LBQ35_07105 [Spirochaetaceae bacterium]|jgi:hypothetical protein|nr:hypothetical protein [Spirochaetaceae bacterium]
MSLQDVMSGGNGDVPPANPTDAATVPAGGGQTGSGPEGDGGTGEGGVQLAAWTQQLSGEIRENPELAKKLSAFKKLDDLAKGYFELAGRSAIPGSDAKPEDVEAFWRNLGYPEKPEGYSLSKEQETGTFLPIAHAARLTDAQAQAVWKLTREGAARQEEARRQAMLAEMAATDEALQKEYGERYDHAMKMLRRGAGTGDVLQRLQAAGLAGRPEIVRAFIALGTALQEDLAHRGNDTGGERDYMNEKWDFSAEKTD